MKNATDKVLEKIKTQIYVQYIFRNYSLL